MSYFRAKIAAMTGYTPGEQPQEPGFLKLNTNENAYPPSPRVLEAIVKAATDRLRLYPDPIGTKFRELAGEVLGVPPDWIVPCNGSDESLTLLTRACLDANDLMVAPTPTYPLYRVLAEIQGCRFEARALDAEGRLPAGFTDGARLVFLANPNSPTGTMIPPRQVLELARNSPCLVAADEAYVDFADDNCMSLVRECDRLAVTRTLSKSHSLAGIRFGYVVAQPIVSGTLRKIKDSYNCDAISLAAAVAAFEDRDYYRMIRDRIVATRAWLTKALAGLGFRVAPSQANFVWVRADRPLKPIFEKLKEKKILIRYLHFPDYGEGLRISIGTDEQMERLVGELRSLV